MDEKQQQQLQDAADSCIKRHWLLESFQLLKTRKLWMSAILLPKSSNPAANPVSSMSNAKQGRGSR